MVFSFKSFLKTFSSISLFTRETYHPSTHLYHDLWIVLNHHFTYHASKKEG